MIFFQEIVPKSEDIYIATRLFMTFYWLTFPTIGILAILTLYFFPKISWSKNFNSLFRFIPYWKNLSILLLITLIVIVSINTLLLFFYAIDTLALGKYDKYSVYWNLPWVKRPILAYFEIVIIGFFLHWIFAIVCYKKWWADFLNIDWQSCKSELKYLAKKLFFRY